MLSYLGVEDLPLSAGGKGGGVVLATSKESFVAAKKPLLPQLSSWTLFPYDCLMCPTMNPNSGLKSRLHGWWRIENQGIWVSKLCMTCLVVISRHYQKHKRVICSYYKGNRRNCGCTVLAGKGKNNAHEGFRRHHWPAANNPEGAVLSGAMNIEKVGSDWRVSYRFLAPWAIDGVDQVVMALRTESWRLGVGGQTGGTWMTGKKETRFTTHFSMRLGALELTSCLSRT